MKKLFLTVFAFMFFLSLHSQYSISTIGEIVNAPSRTATIPLVASDGNFYYFQSRNESIHIRKFNAFNMNLIHVPYSIFTIGTQITIQGVFEDNGYFVIYGTDLEFEDKESGFILKINISTYNPVDLIYTSSGIVDGCKGEKDYNLPTNEFCYSFLDKNGNIFFTNTNLSVNSSLFSINSGVSTHISWNNLQKMFMVSGYMKPSINQKLTEYPFFLTFELNSNYQTGWHLYNSIILREGSYNRLNLGRVVHCLLDDGRVLMVQSSRSSDTTIRTFTKLNFALLNIQSSQIIIDNYKMIKFGTISNFNILLNDMIRNINRNTITLTSYFNDYIEDISLVSIIEVNQNNINYEPHQINDFGVFNRITYNPYDTLGAINIATSLYERNYYNGKQMHSGVLFEHNVFPTSCSQLITGCIESNLLPNYSSINISEYPTFVYEKTLPNRIVVTPWGCGSNCEGYHSNVWSKLFNYNDLLKQNENLTTLTAFNQSEYIDQKCVLHIFKSESFIIQGFEGAALCEIYDMTGKLVYSVVSKNDENNTIPQLSNGIYILKAQDNYGNDKSIKFFKN